MIICKSLHLRTVSTWLLLRPPVFNSLTLAGGGESSYTHRQDQYEERIRGGSYTVLASYEQEILLLYYTSLILH